MRYLFSLGEQGVASLLNLGLSLWLIRHVAPAEYGAYVFWSNTALILTSAQNALTVCHLLALPPGRGADLARGAPERVLLGVTLVLLALAAAGGCAAAALLRSGGGGLARPEIAAFLPGFLLYMYARALAFSRGQAATALALTGAVLACAAGLLGGLVLAGRPVGTGAVLAVLSVSYGAPGAGWIWALSRTVPLRPRAEDWPLLRGYLLESRWVLLGAGSTELLGRFHTFVVTGWFGTAALGTLSAAQVLLRPAVLATNAWSWVGRADLAARRERGDWHGFRQALARGAMGTGLVSLPWAMVVVTAWPLVSARLYGGRYADAGGIALLWGLSAALGGVQVVLNVALQSLRAFRLLAIANIAAAGVTAAATLGLLSILPYPTAIVAMMLGQAVEIGVMAAVLGRHVQRGLRLAS